MKKIITLLIIVISLSTYAQNKRTFIFSADYGWIGTMSDFTEDSRATNSSLCLQLGHYISEKSILNLDVLYLRENYNYMFLYNKDKITYENITSDDVTKYLFVGLSYGIDAKMDPPFEILLNLSMGVLTVSYPSGSKNYKNDIVEKFDSEMFSRFSIKWDMNLIVSLTDNLHLKAGPRFVFTPDLPSSNGLHHGIIYGVDIGLLLTFNTRSRY